MGVQFNTQVLVEGRFLRHVVTWELHQCRRDVLAPLVPSIALMSQATHLTPIHLLYRLHAVHCAPTDSCPNRPLRLAICLPCLT